jgi:hypothetical protein
LNRLRRDATLLLHSWRAIDRLSLHKLLQRRLLLSRAVLMLLNGLLQLRRDVLQRRRRSGR